MSDIKWIKITTDIFDDDKILLIESLPDADAIIVIWFKLLCLAGKQNNSGVFLMNDRIPYTDKMLATIFRRKESTVQLALKTFEEFGMIEVVDGVITIPKWGKHQSLDKMEQRKEYMAGYMRDYRAKQKQLAAPVEEERKVYGKANSKANVSVLDKNREDKIRLEKEKELKKEKAHTTPTVEEVKAYCKERGNSIDAERFVDYYSQQGWKLSNGNPLKDWQAAVRNWERRDPAKATEKAKRDRNAWMDEYA